MAISVSARQRVTSGLWGGRLAGSFAGREESAATELGGRRSRRGRRPLWRTQDEGRKLDPEAIRQEAEYIAALAAEADMFALLDEQRVLRDALTIATARQRKTISSMIKTIERRVVEIEDDEAAIVLIM